MQLVRSDVKKCAMSMAYGVTYRGRTEQLMEKEKFQVLTICTTCRVNHSLKIGIPEFATFLEDIEAIAAYLVAKTMKEGTLVEKVKIGIRMILVIIGTLWRQLLELCKVIVEGWKEVVNLVKTCIEGLVEGIEVGIYSNTRNKNCSKKNI